MGYSFAKHPHRSPQPCWGPLPPRRPAVPLILVCVLAAEYQLWCEPVPRATPESARPLGGPGSRLSPSQGTPRPGAPASRGPSFWLLGTRAVSARGLPPSGLTPDKLEEEDRRREPLMLPLLQWNVAPKEIKVEKAGPQQVCSFLLRILNWGGHHPRSPGCGQVRLRELSRGFLGSITVDIVAAEKMLTMA